MTTSELDGVRAEEFAGRLVGLLNDSMLSLMVSVGHRTGLFDTLAALPPATSVEVAEAAGLDERYVREWLDAMTVGRFVDHDPTAGTYVLPPEHAVLLTRAAGPNNMANMTQFTSLIGGVEDDIVECFQTGGGVPYSRFPKFQDAHGRDERAGTRRHAHRRRTRPRRWPPRPPARGHRGLRHRMRSGPRHQPDGPGVPEQPLHWLRLLRGRNQPQRRPKPASSASRTRRSR